MAKRSTIKTGTKFITFGNMKGGVGKTLGAINVASNLGQLGYKVLLVDCDYQANASHNLDVFDEGIRTRRTLYDGIVAERKTAPQTIIESDFDNLDVIPSRFELFDFAFGNSGLRMNSDLRDWLREKEVLEYDYVILDSRPEISQLFINVIFASDYVVIPILCEAESVFGLSIVLNHLHRIQKTKRELRLIGVYFSNFDKRTSTHRINKQHLENLLAKKKIKILGTVPFSRSAKSATEKRLPLGYAKNPKMPINVAFKELTKEIVDATSSVTGRAPAIPQIGLVESESAFLQIKDSGSKESHFGLEIE